jgi:predicted GTPase
MKPNEKLAAIIITALKRDLASHQGELKILIAGKTGQGKSALVNGLIGHEIAKEGAKVDRCTEEVTEYSMNLEGIRVTVFDSPGLQYCMEIDKDYATVRSMKERCQQLSLVVYCTKMTNHRFSHYDRNAMRTLTQTFGEGFWEHSVIALTFAND